VALPLRGGSGSVRRPRQGSVHREGIGYYAGLDGIRALAIAAVLVYHGGVAWAAGGFLGVEVFFVLSGFLITSLLVAEWRRSATIALTAFWARRARRLLPALFCLVAVVGIYAAVTGDVNPVPGLKGDGIATLFYFGNWHQIATQSNYFAATGPVSPLQHTWSLAIEEQFYIFWPTALLAIIWVGRRALRRRRPTDRGLIGTLLSLTVIVAIVSAVEAALLFHGGQGVNRVYYGTDTRAVSLLTGASLAFVIGMLPPRDRVQSEESRPGRGGPVLGFIGLLALAGVLVMMHYATGGSKWLYPFGMVGLDVAVAVIIAAVVLRPSSATGRVFSVAPARGLGQISYGVYLWHFPIFLWLTTASTGLSATLLLIMRVSATLTVSLVSYVLIEQPVRRRKLPDWLVRSLAPAAMACAFAALLVAAAAAAPPADSAPVPKEPAALAGTRATCNVLLSDTKQYGLAPPSATEAASLQPKWLAAHQLTWASQKRVTFHTCPPRKVLLIGDSLAFSLGLGQMLQEQHYGVEVANAAILGCAFHASGQLNVSGTWQSLPAACPTALRRWQRDERVFKPDVVMVELGYRDEFDWRVNGKVVHLGQPTFDAAVKAQIQRYVQVLGAGHTPILFLSVPFAQPRPQPDGSPSPAASAARHAQINSLIRSVARLDPTHVQVLDVDKVVSPGNRYQQRINGKLVRFDGVHFTIYGAELLAPRVLSTVRAMSAGSAA
jgi:peptidoglycan/LPS O-acetylase OafA/YrhL